VFFSSKFSEYFLEKYVIRVGRLKSFEGNIFIVEVYRQHLRIFYKSGRLRSARHPTVGNIAKAAFKTTMVFVRTNPIVTLIIAAADLSGATDWLFKW
jgi:hypothetical protein